MKPIKPIQSSSIPHSTSDHFPSKLAIGEQFCNRVEERKLLSSNISKARPTVLISPRRYGKSSLVHYVIAEMKLPFASIDLFLAHDDRTVIKRLLVGISEAISRLLPASDQAFEKIKNLFSKFKTSLTLGIFQIELTHEKAEVDAVDQVYSALSALAKLAAQEKKKITIFIDEFQDIAAAESAKSLQGAIRHIAQETSDLAFIFSGSNRHLLLELFDDSSMPLYMLCDKIYLERIASLDYQPHLQNLATQAWGKPLPEMVLTRILSLTELHPFYVNLLCHKVWQGDFPEISNIEAQWENCMEEETRRIRAELEKLTRNQQDVLRALAINPTLEPTGQSFSAQSGIASSSLHQAIRGLFEADMIFKVKNTDPCVAVFKAKQVRVLDPLISFYLKKYA